MIRIVVFLVNIVLFVVEFLLAMRLILKFFSANAASPFVAWIYQNSASLLSPFRGIFPTISIGTFPLELTTLFALIVYVVAGYFIVELLSLGRR